LGKKKNHFFLGYIARIRVSTEGNRDVNLHTCVTFSFTTNGNLKMKKSFPLLAQFLGTSCLGFSNSRINETRRRREREREGREIK
jgi:hypothetical protein